MKSEKWHISGYAGQHEEAGASIEDENDQWIGSSSALRSNTPEGWKEYYSRAHLLASAPELYEALKNANALNPCPMYAEALAKAEGK